MEDLEEILLTLKTNNVRNCNIGDIVIRTRR